MPRVLVPVKILEGETVSIGLITLLGTVDVTVLGYHVLPEQTPADQARLQYEERATDALEDLSEEFRNAGGDADHRLVFTHDREQTVERVADEIGAQARAITGVTGDIDRVLVSLSGDVAVDRILRFLEDLIGDRDIGVTLYLAGKDVERDNARLREAAERLRAAGLEVQTMVATGVSPFEGLIDAVSEHDAIVIGEKAPSLRSLLLGEEVDRVAAASVGPVLVVRKTESKESRP